MIDSLTRDLEECLSGENSRDRGERDHPNSYYYIHQPVLCSVCRRGNEEQVR